jgi:two-component system CheB/CheR fusion protein
VRDEAWMRLAIDEVTDFAIVTLDTRGRVQTWNRGAERLFGFAPDEIVDHSVAVLFTPEDRVAGAPQDEMRRARELGRAEDERWDLRKDRRHDPLQ